MNFRVVSYAILSEGHRKTNFLNKDMRHPNVELV